MILDYIGDQIMLESEIRRVFGNSPDTSKARFVVFSFVLIGAARRGDSMNLMMSQA